MLLYSGEKRRERRGRASLIEDISYGYGGCRSEKGAKLMQQRIVELRRE